MKPLRSSLRIRIVLSIAVVLVPILILMAYGFWTTYRRQVVNLLVDQRQTAQVIGALVDTGFDEGLTVARSLSADPLIQTMDPEQVSPYLQEQHLLLPQYRNLALYDAMGRNAGSSLPIDPAGEQPSVVERNHFQNLMVTSEDQVSGVVMGQISHRPVVTLYAPLRGPAGAPRGAVAVSLDLDYLAARLENVRLRPGQTIFLSDRTGRMAFNTRLPDLDWDQRDLSGIAAIDVALEGEEVLDHSFYNPLFGDYRVAAFVPTTKYQWVVGVSEPRDAALAHIWESARRDLIASAVLLSLALALGFFVSQRLLDPIRRLTWHVEHLGKAVSAGSEGSDLAAPIEVHTNDELETLAESFNDMAHQIRTRVAEVEEANARLGALADASAVLAERTTVQDLAQTAVEQAARILSADSAAIWMIDTINEKIDLVASQSLDPDVFKELRLLTYQSQALPARVVCTGRSQLSESYLGSPTTARDDMTDGEAADGVRYAMGLPLQARQGLAGVFGFSREAPRLPTTAERYTARTLAAMFAAALERAHLIEELRLAARMREEFLNLAAHELKTPLTTFKGYTQFLKQRGGHDEEERQLFRVINAQSDRMAHVIQMLMDVSKLQNNELVLYYSRFSLCELAQEVVSMVQPVSSMHRFAVRCDDAGFVDADRERLLEVLFNLVDNAVKHSPAGGLVEIAVEVQGNEAEVRVVDRGTGIPMDKQDDLFKAFYQVAPMVSPTKGMGLGLYISREILRAHGGRIWFESEEGSGSTFYFSLPCRREREPRVS